MVRPRAKPGGEAEYGDAKGVGGDGAGGEVGSVEDFEARRGGELIGECGCDGLGLGGIGMGELDAEGDAVPAGESCQGLNADVAAAHALDDILERMTFAFVPVKIEAGPLDELGEAAPTQDFLLDAAELMESGVRGLWVHAHDDGGDVSPGEGKGPARGQDGPKDGGDGPEFPIGGRSG